MQGHVGGASNTSHPHLQFGLISGKQTIQRTRA